MSYGIGTVSGGPLRKNPQESMDPDIYQFLTGLRDEIFAPNKSPFLRVDSSGVFDEDMLDKSSITLQDPSRILSISRLLVAHGLVKVRLFAGGAPVRGEEEEFHLQITTAGLRSLGEFVFENGYHLESKYVKFLEACLRQEKRGKFIPLVSGMFKVSTRDIDRGGIEYGTGINLQVMASIMADAGFLVERYSNLVLSSRALHLVGGVPDAHGVFQHESGCGKDENRLR